MTTTPTMKDLIEYYKKQFVAVVAAYGADSDYAVGAFFHLQAAKIGVPEKDIGAWALAKGEALHEEALSLL